MPHTSACLSALALSASMFFVFLALPLLAAETNSSEAASSKVANAISQETLALWPGVVPGEKGDIGEEKDMTVRDGTTPPEKDVIRLGNVSKPTITVFQPGADKRNGAAVIVCPGGGYHILAYDLEGTEVCNWLNSLGVTAVLLKYRVPGRGAERHTASLQDAQRAIGLVRSKADAWDIDPARIGILGFSAGGHLSAAASTNYAERTYPKVDDADAVSCRPDFTILIYPAYLMHNNDSPNLANEIKVDDKTPPAFLAMTQDDPVKVENVTVYGLALKNAKVAAEIHIYPSGGHGYGLRPSEHAVTSWPARAGEWMTAQGWLKKK